MSPDRPDGSGAQDPDHGLDVDAVFADIVAHYGTAPQAPGASPHGRDGDDGGQETRRGPAPGIGGQAGPGESTQRPTGDYDAVGNAPADAPADDPERAPDHDPGPGSEGASRAVGGGIFEPGWNDPLNTAASWDDEGHFVPPTPPPLPPLEPRRKAAWAAMIGSPLLIILLFVLGIDSGSRLTALLSLGFIAGFIYLVATMRSDDRPGGDGAVV